MSLQILDHDAFAARDIAVPVKDMPLEIGAATFRATLTARLYGSPDAPLILVLGGISAGRHVSGDVGWWRDMVGRNKPVDLTKYCVLGFDFIPGDAEAGAHDFVTSGDQATALVHVLRHLGKTRFHAIIGSSYGGMVALSFAAKYPDKARQLVIYGASHRASQMSVARRSLQRRIVRMATRLGDETAGLALARELAMTTYRSVDEFDQRFAEPSAGTDGSISAEVNDYLVARGRAFADVMTARRFMLLSRSIDLHKVEPADICLPVSILACRQDQIVPLKDMTELHQRLGPNAEIEIFDSIHGHDAFLTETETVSRFLVRALEREIPNDG